MLNCNCIWLVHPTTNNSTKLGNLWRTSVSNETRTKPGFGYISFSLSCIYFPHALLIGKLGTSCIHSYHFCLFESLLLDNLLYNLYHKKRCLILPVGWLSMEFNLFLSINYTTSAKRESISSNGENEGRITFYRITKVWEWLIYLFLFDCVYLHYLNNGPIYIFISTWIKAHTEWTNLFCNNKMIENYRNTFVS